MRPIDADAYKSYIRKTYCQHCDGCFDEWRHDDCWQWYAIRTLEEMPTIEAKPIIERNCDYCHNGTHRKSFCQPDGTFIRYANYCEECGRDLTKVVTK